MTLKSLQFQLAELSKSIHKDSIVKKVDKDNFLDIHIPSVNNSKATHLFFNTAKGQIKLCFYVRDIEFIDKVLKKSSDKIETYSQGIRLKNNPVFNSVEDGIKAAKNLLNHIDLTIKTPKPKTKKSITKNKVISKSTKLKSDTDTELISIKTIIVKDEPNIAANRNLNTNWFSTITYFFSKLLSK